ncbi:MAG: hypothetical protein ACYC8S_00525 [Minisyncoccota bacterium]
MIQSSKDGTRLAKRSFVVLGTVYIIFAISKLFAGGILSLFLLPLMMALAGTPAFSSSLMTVYMFLLVGVVLITAGYLLVKGNVIGVYLGWVFILAGVIIVYNNNISLNTVPLVLLVYIAYVNYRAYKALKI